jgi:hypothetical protein
MKAEADESVCQNKGFLQPPQKTMLHSLLKHSDDMYDALLYYLTKLLVPLLGEHITRHL